jgi:hypothetical protein
MIIGIAWDLGKLGCGGVMRRGPEKSGEMQKQIPFGNDKQRAKPTVKKDWCGGGDLNPYALRR